MIRSNEKLCPLDGAACPMAVACNRHNWCGRREAMRATTSEVSPTGDTINKARARFGIKEVQRMAYDTTRPEPPLAPWERQAHPTVARTAEIESIAREVFAATAGHCEFEVGSDEVEAVARNSFALAQLWLAERDRFRATPRPPENATARGLDGSGSIEFPGPEDALRGPRHLLGEQPAQRVGQPGSFQDYVWALFSLADGRPLMASPATPLLFAKREHAEAAEREMRAWGQRQSALILEVRLTLEPTK